MDTFIERNSRLNLSAIRDPQGIYEKHILDSLELEKVISLEPQQTNNAQMQFSKASKTLLDV
ncbi:MAG: class I SAM-dependent methyltransferase [Candidatus Peribacteria bacterium]|nr:MAG: class I SAM-dependent methyltransferase [Candidatus Peribacteria bacterium]